MTTIGGTDQKQFPRAASWVDIVSLNHMSMAPVVPNRSNRTFNDVRSKPAVHRLCFSTSNLHLTHLRPLGLLMNLKVGDNSHNSLTVWL